jgi:hypothetical protein
MDTNSKGNVGLRFTHETESPWPVHFEHSRWWKRRSPVQVRFTLRLRGQRSMWNARLDVKSAWIPTWHRLDHVFMVTWNVVKNHFLEVGLWQNWETMALWMFPIVGLIILFYHVWGPAWIEIHWNSVWLRAWSHVASHYNWGYVTTLHDFGGVLGRPLDTFFWAFIISWLRLLVCVWGGP